MSNMTPQPNILGHFSIGVRDCDVSETFYTSVLAPLGLHLVYKSKPGDSPRTLGYGPDEDHELVNVFEYHHEAHAPGVGFHFAFNARSRSAVDEFHATGIENGGKSNGAPGLRKWYGPTYYAAFLIDPDGWRLEAVCQHEVSSS